MDSSLTPFIVYGSNISYFTGKLEMYLRIKGIPYRQQAMETQKIRPLVRKETGTSQMPAVKMADGRWMSDTTPMIAWLEAQQPEPPIVPTDPVQRFFCLLLEDYADEWLWRPAMHFRWYSAEGAHLQSRHLAEELTQDMPIPMFVKRWMLRRRQRGGYTAGDGITEGNRLQVEDTYLNNLSWLNDVLSTRRFLLGDSPSLADIGFMGPYFRHFSQDPVAAELMRQQGPAVWAWVARMWNCTAADATADWLDGVPEDWGPCLQDIGRAYLPYLNENIAAVAQGKKVFSPTVDGVTYHKARASSYRIWCLEQLREAFTALPEEAQTKARAILSAHGCWEPLWEVETLEHQVNASYSPPFGCSDTMIYG